MRLAEVKWIKISTNLFDNRKIKQLRKMPDGDALICIWLQILLLAGNINSGGQLYITKDVPYTEDMLANEFDRPISTIRLALSTFQAFGMIDIIDDVLLVSNWEKYQNTDALCRIRESTRNRVAAFRERQALLEGSGQCNVTVTHDVTPSNATDIDKEEERDIDTDKDVICGDLPTASHPNPPKPRKTTKQCKPVEPKSPQKPKKHEYGEYKNVLLTDEEYQKLIAEYPCDYQARIERLSGYIESKGAQYKSHYATIRVWARKDKPTQLPPEPESTTPVDTTDKNPFAKWR